MTSERFDLRVPDSARVDTVSAIFDTPAGKPHDTAVLLAHGAGANMESAFMQRAAEGLVAAGHEVLRFDYPYQERARREGKRRPPDRRPALEDTHRVALGALRERVDDRRIVLAGKSMGGRMGSYLAAEGADCAGLFFYGYPLHPPGKPDKPRSEHFPTIAQPALFLQGTRDNLCRLELLEGALETFGGRTTLVELEGADHGFKIPKKLGGDGSPPWDQIDAAIADWMASR